MVDGRSLVPDISGSLNMLFQTFGTKQQRDERNQAEQQYNELNSLISQVPDMQGADQQRALARIAAIQPKAAEALSRVIESGNNAELAAAKSEAERGLRESSYISRQSSYQGKINALRTLAEQAQTEGRNIDRYLELANMPEERLDLELQRMQIMGTDVVNLTDKPKKTSLMQNLEAAGLQPGTPEYQQAINNNLQGIKSQARLEQDLQVAEAGRSTTDVRMINQAENTERVETAKVNAKQYDRMVQDADTARETVENLEQLASIDVKTGALEPAKARLASVIEGFGVDASAIANASNAEAYEAVSNRLVNNVLNAAKGPQTEGDAARARQVIASLGDTPQGADFKINSMKALAMRKIEMADFIQSEIDGGKTFSQARAEWNKYKRETPLLSDSMKNPATGLPIFFNEFKDNARAKRPGITDAEVVEAWREING